MEKVKVTQEQANAIDQGIDIYSKSRIMNDHEPDGWKGTLACLNGFTKDEIARALYIGYEIEPVFENGDWVFRKTDKKVYKVFNCTKGIVLDDENESIHSECVAAYDSYTSKNEIRHATPEEIATEKTRRWWDKHDREVWYLKQGDLIRNKLSGYVKEIEEHQRATESYAVGSWEVACFAEDRKDIKS